MRNLSQTFLYNMYKESFDLQKRILELYTNAKVVNPPQIEEQLKEIDKKFIFASKGKVMESYNSHKITPIYNSSYSVLPNSLPFFMINEKVFVNLSNYGNMTNDGLLNIKSRHLFTLLQGGWILETLYSKNKTMGIQTNVKLVEASSLVYTELFIKVLNKSFSLNLNPLVFDAVKYVIATFFCYNLMDIKDLDKCHNIAIKQVNNENARSVTRYDDDFVETDYEDLSKFIKRLSEVFSSLRELQVRTFIELYIKQYGTTMLFSLEYLPIFYYNVFAIIVGSNINNQYVIENILGRNLDDVYIRYVNIF